MRAAAALLLLAAGARAAPLPNDTKCNFHGKAAEWMLDENLRQGAMLKQRTPVTPPHVKINLDLPPEDRWTAALAPHKDVAAKLQAYLDSMIPPWAVELLEAAMGPVVKYRGFGDEYTREMESIAKALNTSVGTIVTINLIYQLEHIGVNCSNWNDTGPTGLCTDGVAYPFKGKLGGGATGPPGACTSIVAQRADGAVVHVRNFDWNLPNELRPLIWEVEFQRGGKHIFTGTGVVGYVGVQNAMKPGKDGFAFTMDARCQGGQLVKNFADMLLAGGQTPTQHARHVMETAVNYEDALQRFASGWLVDPIYYIVSGPSKGQGAIVARGREKAVDIWSLDDADADGWWRLQTNYDHWMPVPKADDRRTPGNNMMRALGGPQGVSADSVRGVLLQWPLFNYHTDHTAVFVVADGTYNTTVWMGDDPSTGPPATKK
eukprot:TRINITY_DN549_c0_g2_i1.p1 TRINITY_DN549_c0_g2~~TRINITY_DN549_c0_g2_i1.p1  ORF type:complete len:458 (+),score=151.91 TRINITY_DN549_c0_g2_i1:79-1374(+)